MALTMVLALAPTFAWADPNSASDAAASSDVIRTADDSALTRWLQDAPPASSSSGPLGDVLQLGDDRKLHGEVGIGGGTNGYFEGYAAVSVPFGQTGRLGVAYDDAQINRPWRARQQSLAVDVSVGDRAGSVACGKTVRVGHRDVAPLWVSNFQTADGLTDVDPRCAPQPAPSR
jgi:hypothetical protein